MGKTCGQDRKEEGLGEVHFKCQDDESIVKGRNCCQEECNGCLCVRICVFRASLGGWMGGMWSYGKKTWSRDTPKALNAADKARKLNPVPYALAQISTYTQTRI